MPKSPLAIFSFFYNQGRQACAQSIFIWLKLVRYTEIQSGYKASLCNHKGEKHRGTTAFRGWTGHSTSGEASPVVSRREGSSLHTCWKHSSYCSPRCHRASLRWGHVPSSGPQVLHVDFIPLSTTLWAQTLSWLPICFTVCTPRPHLISISLKGVSKALLKSR